MTSSTPTLFKPLPGADGASIDIFFNDRALTVQGGRSVAAALLAAGVSRFRATPVLAHLARLTA